MKKERRLTCRDFLKLAGVALLEPILLTIGAAEYGFLVETNSFKVETIPLKLPRLPRKFSGFRVAHISDIHMGGWMNLKRLQHAGELIIAEKPDVLLITGDFLIGRNPSDVSQQMILNLITGLSGLAERVPTFAVLGNHDYWTGVAGVRYALASSGIRDLTNTVFTLRRENENLHICGVDDIWVGEVRLDRVIAQMDDGGAAILLAHEPDFADTSAATGRFDLQLSGHSHGGQVVLPLLGPPILPYLGRKYPLGLYRVGEMFQYTNRGLGMARLAIRINCPPEVTIFVLESTTS
jgi:predicted MPP superfamily phosphohydrolase